MLSQAFVTSRPSSPGSLTPVCPSKFDNHSGLQMSPAPSQAGLFTPPGVDPDTQFTSARTVF